MILRFSIIYIVAAALAFFLLRSKNAALREDLDLLAAQTPLPESTNPEPKQALSQASPSTEAAANAEEAPIEIPDITEPIVIPTTISAMADRLAEFFTLGNQLDNLDLGPNPNMEHPMIERFMRLMPTLIGAFDVHEEALKNPEIFGSFMAEFAGQTLNIDSDSTEILAELYTNHRIEAISQGLVSDGPRHEDEEARKAWLQDRHAFAKAFKETVKVQIAVDLESIPMGWGVTSQVSEMKQVLSL